MQLKLFFNCMTVQYIYIFFWGGLIFIHTWKVLKTFTKLKPVNVGNLKAIFKHLKIYI